MGIAREDIDQMVELGLAGAGRRDGRSGQRRDGGDAGRAARHRRPGSLSAQLPRRSRWQASATPAMGLPSAQQRYKDAYPIATQLTGSLGLRGFRLNLSVEGSRRPTSNWLALAPKIRAAVGDEKAAALDRALGI